MFNIYLTNWVDEVIENNQTNYYLIDEETLIMSVPFSEDEEPCMINPTIKSDMGKAESLDFTINPGMKYYNAYQELKTLIRVEYKESPESEEIETIFFGRVVTINTSNLLAIKSIHAEGAYSVLQDTPIEGLEEELQQKISQWKLFENIISEHNGWIGENNNDSWKRMRIVDLENIESPINLKDETKKCAPTSWNTAMSAIDNLIENNGGYMKVRYDPTKATPLRLEWHRKYFRDLGTENENLRPKFQLTKNIIDLSSTDEVSEIFTRIIPIGHKATKTAKETGFIYVSGKIMTVQSIANSLTEKWLHDNFQSRDEFVHAEELYGIIYKTVNFPNADTVAKLEEYATDWIKRNYFGALRSFTVKAIDMKMVNMEDAPSHLILAGDCVDISYPYFDQFGNRKMTTDTRLVCKSAQIVLFNPEQNTYTIGIPNDAIDFEYGEKSKKKKGSASAASGDRPTGTSPTQSKSITFKSVLGFLAWIYYWAKWGNRDEAISNYAYTWYRWAANLGAYNPSADSRPYKTFRANGEQKRLLDELDEDGNRQYGPVTFDFVGVPSAIVLGHYQTRGWTYADDANYSSKVPNYIRNKNGYHYGIAYSGDTVFTFSWETYQRYIADGQMGIQPAPIFSWPTKLVLEHATTSLEEMDMNQISSPGDGVDADPLDGALVLTDPVTGMPNVEIFPESGQASFGVGTKWVDDEGNEVAPGTEGATQVPDPTKWFTTINTPITYTGTDGLEHTIQGCIVANDIQLPEIPSFKTKLAVVDDLIAARATIGELRAFTALLGDALPQYDENGECTGYYDGTILQTDINGMKGVSGIYEVNDNGTVKTDALGRPLIKEGGGFSVMRNGAAIGLWEDGAMRAGLDVTKKSDGSYQTTINGDYVILGSGLDDKTIEEWATDSKDGKGVFANYFRAKKLKVDDADVENSLDVAGNMKVDNNAFIAKKLTAGNMVLGIGGSFTFTGQTGTGGNNTTTIDVDDAHNLMDSSNCRVKITRNNNDYTLWYLPLSQPYVDTPSTNAGWKIGGNFSRAASITGLWSSDKFPLNVCAHPTGTNISSITDSNVLSKYTIGFSGDPNVLLDLSEKIILDGSNKRTNLAPVGNDGKTLFVPIAVNEVELDDGGQPTNPIERYSTSVTVDGTNAYKSGWNSGGGTAKLVNPSNVDAASPLSRGVTYTVAYTNAEGSLTKTGRSYTVPSSGNIVLSTNSGAAHGSTASAAITNSGFEETNQSNYTKIYTSTGELTEYNEHYVFRVTCGNADTKYYYFKTPSKPSITVSDWKRTNFTANSSRLNSRKLDIPISVKVNGTEYSHTFQTGAFSVKSYTDTYVHLMCGSTSIGYFKIDG